MRKRWLPQKDVEPKCLDMDTHAHSGGAWIFCRTIKSQGARKRTLLGSEEMVSLRDSYGASSRGDSSGCVTVNARDSSSSELGSALHAPVPRQTTYFILNNKLYRNLAFAHARRSSKNTDDST